MLPPTWVRRVVLAPAMLALTAAVVFLFPLWLLIALLLVPFLGGRWRPARILWMVLVHLVLEAYVLLRLFGLWVASGFGRTIRSPAMELAHYRLIDTYLSIMVHEANRVLHLRYVIDDGLPSDPGPLLVLSRHAGPGDSFLLVHLLMQEWAREPRIVLKDTLQWDPAIDVLLNRLPNQFIRPGGDGAEEVIGTLARGLDDNDAFVIFPEGGNFTERRRARGIARLRERGLVGEAEKAERMRHVLAPKPGGVLAALDNAPDADVVMVAHSGLDHVLSVVDVWRALPMDTVVHVHCWTVPRSEVPTTREARIAWLYEWWARIDEWIGENRPVPARTLR